MSLRLRLTLLYSAILALTLLLFNGALYVTVFQTTRNVLEETLHTEAKRLTESRRFELDHIDMSTRKLTAPRTFVQTRRMDGVVMDRVNLGDATLPLNHTQLQHVREGHELTEIVQFEGDRLLVLSMPIKQFDQTSGIIQIARSLEDLERMLSTLQQILIIGSSLATLVAFGVGWVLAGAALRPIDRLTQTAHDIGVERDFGRRVQYVGPADEVGRLAMTFNTMLAQLQAAYRQVQQSLFAQRRFVADASHELRTPLTTIRGNLGLMQRVPPIKPEDQEAVLRDLVDETERLMRLVNDLLVLARADGGRSLQREPVEIRPLLEDMCRRAHMIDEGQTIHCDNLIDAVVVGDLDALRQVVLILLDNAIKFTPADGTITLQTAVIEKRVAISIIDTGVGIPSEMLPHIFERFYRGDMSRTGGGTGLGLAIARALVEAQHGTITVESKPGEGSTFTVLLPLAELSEAGAGAEN